jgi:uncharacterized protein with gpF-like domain
MAKRTPNPSIPGSPTDRTGTGSILRRAIAEIDHRFDGLQSEVLAIFDRIRIYGANDVAMPAERTVYAMTPEEMAATSQALGEAFDRWIESGRDKPVAWWDAYSAEAAHLGTAQSVANLARLSEAYAATRSLQHAVYSEPYRNRVAMAQIKSYDHWTAMSSTARSELSQIIGAAVADGKNPKAVRTEIMNRLDVTRSKAAQYAQTDITDTLRQSRWSEADYATENLGLNIQMLWTSALIPSTRPWHASRNGKVYTTQEVREFYGSNGNRYRCHCGQTECLVDDEGRPILTQGLKDKMQAEKKAWQSENLGV